MINGILNDVYLLISCHLPKYFNRSKFINILLSIKYLWSVPKRRTQNHEKLTSSYLFAKYTNSNARIIM